MNCEREFLTRKVVRPWHSCPEKLWVQALQAMLDRALF